jgi:hypothetical protein
MAASDKIRWKRMVNEIRFLHNEKELIQQINSEAGPNFQEHYLKIAAENGLDIKALNKENEEKIKEAYTEDAPSFSSEDFPDMGDPQPGALTVCPQPAAEDPEHNETQDDIEIHDSFNKLFRRLAMKLHPDKMGGSVTIEQGIENLHLFQEAKEALNKRKYFILLDLAERFSITQSRNYKQQIRWMKKESSRIAGTIDREKDTYNYLFADCETDDQKDTIVKRFLFQLFGILLE